MQIAQIFDFWGNRQIWAFRKNVSKLSRLIITSDDATAYLERFAEDFCQTIPKAQVKQ